MRGIEIRFSVFIVVFAALTAVAAVLLLISCGSRTTTSLPGKLYTDTQSTYADGNLSNGNNGNTKLDWNRIDLGDGFILRYKSDADINARIRGANTAHLPDLRVVIDSPTDQRISYFTGELFFDGTSFTTNKTEFYGTLANADINLSLTNLPDRAALGAAFIGLDTRAVAAGETLAVIELRYGSSRQISQSVNPVPQGEENKPLDLNAQWNAEEQVLDLSFQGRNIGDYDQSGEVGIPDVTPIAQYFGVTEGSIVDVVDGDPLCVITD